jgi:hypothetical protein
MSWRLVSTACRTEDMLIANEFCGRTADVEETESCV